MKKLLVSGIALIALAAPALAADMPPRPAYKAPAYTAPALIYNWTGFYIGGHVGGAFAGGGLITTRNDQLASVTGRFGYTRGPALLYAKGGFAWRDNPNIGVTVAGTPAGFTTNGA